MSKDRKPDKPKRGPEAERLKFDVDWEDAAKRIVQKERPAEGWPAPDNAQSEQDEDPGK